MSYQSFPLRFLYAFCQSLKFKCQSNLETDMILNFHILICSTLMNVFPSYLMLCNIFSWNSIVKYPGLITDVFFLTRCWKITTWGQEKIIYWCIAWHKNGCWWKCTCQAMESSELTAFSCDNHHGMDKSSSLYSLYIFIKSWS
jgi:hypothetical protein